MSRTASEAAAAFADVVCADQQWVDAEFAELVATSFGEPPAPPPPARHPAAPALPAARSRPGRPPVRRGRAGPGPTALAPAASTGGRSGRRARPLNRQAPRSSPIPATEGGQAGQDSARPGATPGARRDSPAGESRRLLSVPAFPPDRGPQPARHMQQHHERGETGPAAGLGRSCRPGTTTATAARSASSDDRNWAASPATAASATPTGSGTAARPRVTFWSGIVGDGPDGPLLFCTCAGIRRPDGRTAYQRVWGWPDITAARAGHRGVTAWIGQVAGFLAGHASRLPAPGPADPAVREPRRAGRVTARRVRRTQPRRTSGRHAPRRPPPMAGCAYLHRDPSASDPTYQQQTSRALSAAGAPDRDARRLPAGRRSRAVRRTRSAGSRRCLGMRGPPGCRPPAGYGTDTKRGSRHELRRAG